MNDNRNDVIEKVIKQKNIYKKKEKYYVLKHTYDIAPSPVIIKTTIDSKTMDLLVAYLQYKADGMKHAFSFHQTDMADLLEKYFDCEVIESHSGSYYEIDLYENWEHWCSKAAEVESIPHFHNESLLVDLKTLVSKEEVTY